MEKENKSVMSHVLTGLLLPKSSLQVSAHTARPAVPVCVSVCFPGTASSSLTLISWAAPPVPGAQHLIRFRVLSITAWCVQALCAGFVLLQQRTGLTLSRFKNLAACEPQTWWNLSFLGCLRWVTSCWAAESQHLPELHSWCC